MLEFREMALHAGDAIVVGAYFSLPIIKPLNAGLRPPVVFINTVGTQFKIRNAISETARGARFRDRGRRLRVTSPFL